MQLKIERVKQQKAGAKFRRLQKDMVNKVKLIQDVFAKIDQLKYTVDIYHMLYERELTHLRTITFRGLIMMQQIMASTMPHVPLSFEDHNNNLAQLLNELSRTILHLQKPYTNPDNSPVQ